MVPQYTKNKYDATFSCKSTHLSSSLIKKAPEGAFYL
jgi:hypothetical protein